MNRDRMISTHSHEQGSVLVEFGLALPVYLGVLTLCLSVGHWQWSKAMVDNLAYRAARTCSIDRPAANVAFSGCLERVLNEAPIHPAFCESGTVNLRASPSRPPSDLIRSQPLTVWASCTSAMMFGTQANIVGRATTMINPP